MARMSAEDRRQLLIEAAVRVMSREGVAQTTTRLIVAEAGMPLGVFHYCFRSKEELLDCVMEQINQNSFQAALPELTGTETLYEVLLSGVRAYWKHAIEDPTPHQLTYELTQHSLRLDGQAALKQYQMYYSLMAAFIGMAVEGTGGQLALPPATASRYLLAVLEGATLQWLADQDAEAALVLLEQCVAQLCGVLAVSPSTT